MVVIDEGSAAVCGLDLGVECTTKESLLVQQSAENKGFTKDDCDFARILGRTHVFSIIIDYPVSG